MAQAGYFSQIRRPIQVLVFASLRSRYQTLCQTVVKWGNAIRGQLSLVLVLDLLDSAGTELPG
jgi:hypothetical protein